MSARLDLAASHAPIWLPEGHSQTIYSAKLAHYHRIAFLRQRIETPDGDFLDFDWSGPGLFPRRAPAGTPPANDGLLPRGAALRWMQPSDWEKLPTLDAPPALVLFHGLEGNSSSHYAQSIAQYFRARGWVVVIPHFRGCSGAPNRLARAYHSGDSQEIGFILDTLRAALPHARWHAAGVSLGGNALLKYLGEQGAEADWLNACAGISVPLDLVAAGEHLSDNRFNRYVYGGMFLRALKRKVMQKAQWFPGVIDIMRVTQARHLRDFDDAYTAPMHGFENAHDYWARSSSKQFLPGIAVPTLVLNARNDPFLPESALPGPSEASDAVLLHQPADGGHGGFPSGNFPCHLNWLPQRLARFFDTQD
ncbi:alpha/beta fold hydrolase [Kerstersia gyiorum]|uniref:YheT family hydrolase n=1 Tax=Kerstersia gyiorum TaxID=206506 RepID=UPI00214FEBF5|nr:alpha/beta fold hydrolase [Kerstersia gyiorum]MCR4159289.1 alpha/beta fold hydrolase [Kerstersia gyiorum]